jgi:hypothetical protein
VVGELGDGRWYTVQVDCTTRWCAKDMRHAGAAQGHRQQGAAHVVGEWANLCCYY